MEDLLREDEFLPKQKAYNPWKRFTIFYALAGLNLTLLYGIAKLDENYSPPLVITASAAIFSVLLFVAMPFLMIFHNKNYILVKKKTIILSVSLLMLSYGITYAAITIFESGLSGFINYFLTENIMITSISQGYGVLSCLIIIPILNRKQKALKNGIYSQT